MTLLALSWQGLAGPLRGPAGRGRKSGERAACPAGVLREMSSMPPDIACANPGHPTSGEHRTH
ncbi:MAG: hypothetical protein P4M06_12525, partial [Pandoraea sp.]|nr:hypothetical protein [Pandoraea sp.]